MSFVSWLSKISFFQTCPPFVLICSNSQKNMNLSNRQIHNLISHLDVSVPKDRKHLIQILRIFLVQKGYIQLVAEFPHNLCE